mmetsp:Transcript_29133/g.28189  ORF Transcript_29133/g.28189 Transcript_29133/m.28189 type:complete len:94 (+) Transcript_29133:545-826(+)
MRSSASTQTTIVLDWAVEPDTETAITGYSLEWDDDGDGNFDEIWDGRGYPNILTHTLSVTTGQTYYFRHKAFTYNEESAYSNILTLLACIDPT